MSDLYTLPKGGWRHLYISLYAWRVQVPSEKVAGDPLEHVV